MQIPKIIHIYTHDKLSNFQQILLNRIRQINDNYHVKLYTFKDIIKIKEKPEFITQKFHIIQHIYDNEKKIKSWFKFYILYKFGGIWIDINTIFFHNIDTLFNKSTINNSNIYSFEEFIGKEIPTNYFIACAKNNSIIKSYLNELTIAFKNNVEYCEKNYEYAVYNDILDTLPYSIEELIWLKLVKNKVCSKDEIIIIKEKNNIENPTYWITQYIAINYVNLLDEKDINKCLYRLFKQKQFESCFIYLYKNSIIKKIKLNGSYMSYLQKNTKDTSINKNTHTNKNTNKGNGKIKKKNKTLKTLKTK